LVFLFFLAYYDFVGQYCRQNDFAVDFKQEQEWVPDGEYFKSFFFFFSKNLISEPRKLLNVNIKSIKRPIMEISLAW